MFDWDEFDKLVAEKYINVQTHPTKELYIANYAAKVQFEKKWDDITEQCRGLIFDKDHNIIARPFRKFFNYSEVRPPAFVLTKTPHVTTKMDGSLGIYYRYDGVEGIATRGSFASDQAVWATAYWAANHSTVVVPDGQTPLFEIVYPSNRIVVDYHGEEFLILLAVIDNATGADVPLWEATWWDGPVVDVHYGLDNVEDAYTFGTGMDGEGIVCAWPTPGEPSYRLKVKAPEYVRLHRLVTGVSSKTIWGHLKENRSLDELIDNVPDEFYDWVKKTAADLDATHWALMKEIYLEFDATLKAVMDANSPTTTLVVDSIRWCEANRPVFARYVTHNCKHKGSMFSLLDNKIEKVRDAAWELVKPTFQKPFMEVSEDE